MIRATGRCYRLTADGIRLGFEYAREQPLKSSTDFTAASRSRGASGAEHPDPFGSGISRSRPGLPLSCLGRPFVVGRSVPIVRAASLMSARISASASPSSAGRRTVLGRQHVFEERGAVQKYVLRCSAFTTRQDAFRGASGSPVVTSCGLARVPDLF